MKGAALIGGLMGSMNPQFESVAKQFTADEWRRAWPNPVPMVLGRFEQGRLAGADSAVLDTYEGMVGANASQILDDNERQLDKLLAATKKVEHIEEYAAGLREAAQIRDRLEARKRVIKADLERAPSLLMGPLQAMGPPPVLNPYKRMDLLKTQASVEEALGFWNDSFPLLTRLPTSEIKGQRIRDELLKIKANISTTRAELERSRGGGGRLDMWQLSPVRQKVAKSGQIGPKTENLIEQKDKHDGRTAIAAGVGMAAVGIALLFVPGGAFIDLAISAAMTAKAWDHAAVLRSAADTSVHIDDGLVSQASAKGARLSAILQTIFLVAGTAAMGFRIFRRIQAVAQEERVAGAASHMFGPGSIVKRSKGINGGHLSDDFKAALAGQGEVISKTPVRGLDGVYKVTYKLFRMDRGKITSVLQDGEPFVKTVFESGVWNQQKLAKLAAQIFGKITKDGTHEVSQNGITFIGWVRNGALDSFGVK